MNKTTIFIVLLFLSLGKLVAQKFPSKGIPLIHNYSPEHFGDAGKAWSVNSAGNGIVYFATDNGLLEFDGASWNLFPGSKGFTRSVHIANDSVGYTGADKDFGRWQRNDLQQFEFTSLNPFRESTKGLNQEFWGTYQIDEDLVFVSFDNIYVYKGQQLTQIAAPSRFTGSFFSRGQVYVVDQEEGLLSFNGLSLIPLVDFSSVFPVTPTIVGVHQAQDHTLLVTRKQGAFRFSNGKITAENNDVTTFLKRDQVFSFTSIDGTHYAYGTILNGIYITDLSGNIIQHINKQKGLLNNTVLSMHYSQQGKLWLSMDFGITSIDLWSDVAYFSDQTGKVGTGHTALLHEGVFYLGTNQGLYTIEWEDLQNDRQNIDFTLVSGSSGQVWSLEVVQGDILCGHDRGLFAVQNNRLSKISDRSGVLTLQEFNDKSLLAGTYNGVALYQRGKSTWEFSNNLAPIQGACDQVVPGGNGDLWINIPNFGVINAQLDSDYNLLEQTIFPLSDFGDAPLQLSPLNGSISVITDNAEYTYQPARQAFTQAALETPHKEVKHVLPGKYQPLVLNEAYSFYPVYNGFALQNMASTTTAPAAAPLIIRSAQAIYRDSSLQFTDGATLFTQQNNIRINFTIPHQDKVEYQYTIGSKPGDWSAWSAVPYAEFMGLYAGDYTFRVRAKADGVAVNEQQLSFSIAYPWYQSWWAYALFAALMATLFYLNYRWQQWALKKQEVHLRLQEESAQKEQAWLAGQQNLKKRYATLEDAIADAKKQLRSKTIELAKKAKESEEKGRLLQALREKISGLEEEATSNKFRWTQLSQMLEAYPEGEDNSFDLQMEELNREFIAKLSELYPDLTTYDLRLSTYLKTGHTTKEIATHLNVLTSSVNVSRSRLRKKLQLDSKTDLYKFLNSL